MTSIQIRRHELRFLPDCSRVLMRSFIPADRSRLTQIIGRALALSEEETERELEKVRREFSARHRDLDSLLWAFTGGSRYMSLPTGRCLQRAGS